MMTKENIHWINEAFCAMARSDSEAALSLLQDHKNDLKAEDEEGVQLRANLLHQAIHYSCYPLIAFTLGLASPPDISFYRLYGNTPIALALEKNDSKMIDIIRAKSDKSFALHAAVKSKQKNLVSALLGQFSFSDRLLKYLGLK